MRALIAVVLLGLTGAASAEGAGAQLDPERVQWSQLQYRASKFLLSLDTEITLKALPAADARAELMKPAQGVGLEPSGPQAYRVDIVTDVFGQNTLVQLWLDQNAAALQRSTLYTGRKLRYRNFRHTTTGAYSLKRHPRKGEEGLPWQSWSDVAEDFYPYGDAASGLVLTETAGLMYIVSASNLEKVGDALEFYVFTKDGLGRAYAQVTGRAPLRAEYEEVSPRGSASIDGPVDVFQISLSVRPLDPARGMEEIEFLGLKGNLELYVEPTRRAVLQLSGKADVVGSLDIKLRKIVLR